MAKHYKDASNFAHSSQVLASVTVMLAVSGSSSEKLVFFLFSQKLINRQLYRAVRLLPKIRFKPPFISSSHFQSFSLSSPLLTLRHYSFPTISDPSLLSLLPYLRHSFPPPLCTNLTIAPYL